MIGEQKGIKAMNPKLKLAAGPGKVSVKLLTVEEIRGMGLIDLENPLCYGLIISIGWNYTHIAEGMIVIFDINKVIKLKPDTYIIEGKDIIGKLIHEKEKKKEAALITENAYEGLADEIPAK